MYKVINWDQNGLVEAEGLEAKGWKSNYLYRTLGGDSVIILWDPSQGTVVWYWEGDDEMPSDREPIFIEEVAGEGKRYYFAFEAMIAEE